ncbi:MAG TPA: DUF805 domain-containing protein [Candidatus Saccharimonadales bacterium]|nr:DUF805 domain-containing protein [Candidatus Saccharimonadales bacterium]
MDNQHPNQPQQPASQALPQTPIPTSQSEPKIIVQKSQPNYFVRLFSGRLNRQNYIVGSTALVLVPLICFLFVLFNILSSQSLYAMSSLDVTNTGNVQITTPPQISITSLLVTPANETWTIVAVIFTLLSLPYLLSLQIRRLHDLNLNGWLWIINFLPLIFIKQLVSFSELLHPDIWFVVANILSLVTGIFSLYVTFAPGTKGANTYGEPPLPRSSFVGDVLAIK